MEPSKVILVDRLNSALGVAARFRAQAINSDVVAIVDFKSPEQLIAYLKSKNYKILIFSWRRGLLEALTSKKFLKQINENRANIKIGIIIADYLGLEGKYLLEEELLLNSIDAYWTTNLDILRKYQFLNAKRKPIGIFHDIPDFNSITNIRKNATKLNKIIWVGNSKWGSKYGFDDHKGFYHIVEPLFEILKKLFPDYKFRKIDSSELFLGNIEVLKEISEAKILIQASVNEGTGLPLLEALGLGVIPITTNVGVVAEILTGDLNQYIVERNVASFVKKITELLSNYPEETSFLCASFDNHIENILKEDLVFNTENTSSAFIYSFSIFQSIRIRCIWLYRYLRTV